MSTFAGPKNRSETSRRDWEFCRTRTQRRGTRLRPLPRTVFARCTEAATIRSLLHGMLPFVAKSRHEFFDQFIVSSSVFVSWLKLLLKQLELFQELFRSTTFNKKKISRSMAGFLCRVTYNKRTGRGWTDRLGARRRRLAGPFPCGSCRVG